MRSKSILVVIGVLLAVNSFAQAVAIDLVPVGDTGNAGELSGADAGGYGSNHRVKVTADDDDASAGMVLVYMHQLLVLNMNGLATLVHKHTQYLKPLKKQKISRHRKLVFADR